jgi:hypothetical protein
MSVLIVMTIVYCILYIIFINIVIVVIYVLTFPKEKFWLRLYMYTQLIRNTCDKIFHQTIP